MRRLLLAALAVSLVSMTAAAEDAPEPATPVAATTRASIGLFAGIGGGWQDSYTVPLKGARIGAHLTPRNWIMVSFGRGEVDTDWEEDVTGSGAWETEVSLTHLRCNRGTAAICLGPTLGVGYQDAWVEWYDEFYEPGMDPTWLDKTSRLFMSARATGRVVFDEHVSLELALGMRASYDEYGEHLVLGGSATAALDAAF